MLHRQTLPTSALDLLIALCRHPALKSFALAGGTSLALRFGHRISVDLDFFSSDAFENDSLVAALKQDYDFDDLRRGPTGVSGYLNGVKVDFVKYLHPLIRPIETIQDIRLMSLPDVVAMKLSAVTNRGAKKDFYDVHTLILELGLPVMLDLYTQKYPGTDPLMLLRSLCYFQDAESDTEPESLIGVTWPEVKMVIASAVKEMLDCV